MCARKDGHIRSAMTPGKNVALRPSNRITARKVLHPHNAIKNLNFSIIAFTSGAGFKVLRYSRFACAYMLTYSIIHIKANERFFQLQPNKTTTKSTSIYILNQEKTQYIDEIEARFLQYR